MILVLGHGSELVLPGRGRLARGLAPLSAHPRIFIRPAGGTLFSGLALAGDTRLDICAALAIGHLLGGLILGLLATALAGRRDVLVARHAGFAGLTR